MRILVAEDDITSRMILQAILNKYGYEVVLAVDGDEAWTALKAPDAPKLAILDWMMPIMDGVGVCRSVRAIETDCPPYLILLTTRDKKEDIVEGLGSGANDYLAKPYDPRELIARVEVGRRVVELQTRLTDKVRELHEALEDIKTLRGIIPICSHCKKVRDDEGYWTQVEVYVRDHSEAQFTHGICPECIKRFFPDFAQI